MANFIKEKLILIKGEAGEPGDDATDTTVPLDALFYYSDTAEIPTGYEETSPPTPPTPTYLYNWDFTESLVDKVQGRAVNLSNQNIYVEGVGLVFNNTALSYVYFTNINYMTTTVEIDIATMNKQFSSSSHGRFIMIDDANGFIFRKSNYNNWQVYGEKNNSSAWRTYEQTSNNPDIFSGKTLKLKFNNSSDMEIYADNELVYKGEPFTDLNQEKGFYINSSAGQGFYNMTITGVRIYENEE